MIAKSRISTRTVIGLLALGYASLGALAAEPPLDTSQLPRMGGSKVIYQSAPSTILTTTDSVAGTAEAVKSALSAQGWQRYVAPFTSRSQDPNTQTLSFKKGSLGLSVFITVAPAQNNATSIQYNAIALQTVLPFPPDATDIEFSPDRPHLICMTAEPVESSLAFFGKELAGLGWSAWSTKDVAKIPAGEKIGESTDKGGRAFFVRDNRPPVMLTLRRTDDGRTRAEIQVIPATDLNPAIARNAEMERRAREEAQRTAAQEAAKARMAQSQAPIDAMTAEIMKEAQRATREALSGATAPARPPQQQAATNEAPLRPLAGSDAPVPVPDTAEDVENEDGKLEFTSKSSVAAIADFYRSSMKQQGWREQRSVINRSNMVVLDFNKDRKKISFTIMQLGPSVKVTANGSGLVTAAASPAGKGRSTAAPEPEVIQDLEAEETRGLPVPKQHTNSGAESTPFRIEATATVSAGIGSVLAFYRRELASRNWKEDTASAEVQPNRATLKFSSDAGPAVLKLERKGDETTISLAWRKIAEAQKSGLLPKPGQVKVLFGNIMDGDSVVTLNRKAIKVPAGVGTKGPDGPSMELPPGKYRYSIKSGAKPAQSDEIVIGAGEIWGLMIGPGGGLAIQMY